MVKQLLNKIRNYTEFYNFKIYILIFIFKLLFA